MLAFAACCLVLGACRPLARTCSSRDRCADDASCVGGRCEPRGVPAAVLDSERVVLLPQQVRAVRLGGVGALFLEFEIPELAADAFVEGHLLLRLPHADGWARVYRVTGPWHERSTSAAEALTRIGPVESESRLIAGGSDLVRLHLSRESVHAQRILGWVVQTEPGLSEADGIRLAEASEDGPRLELYLRRPDAHAPQKKPR